MRRPVNDRKPFVIGLSYILLLFLALCLLPRGAGANPFFDKTFCVRSAFGT